MLIQIENTPNENALKFIPGKDVLPDGVSFKSYASVDDCSSSPLAKEILSIDGIIGVFLADNFITVSKKDELDWDGLKTKIISIMMDFYSNGSTIYFDEKISHNTGSSDDDVIVAKIKDVLDTRIRPAVAQDGGDINFVSFDSGVLVVKMLGACDGCPSAGFTLQMAVSRVIKHFVPEVVDIKTE